MTEEGKTDHGKNGTRWYDPHKVTLSLFGVLFLIVCAWSGVVYGMAHTGETKNVEQDEKIKAMKEGLEKMDAKLDRLLERK